MDCDARPRHTSTALTARLTDICLRQKYKTDPELDGHSFVAVYDGHGGSFSAIFCGRHMIDFIKRTASFQEYKK